MLAWLIYFVAKDSDFQAEIRKQVQDIVTNGMVDYNKLESLPMLNAAVCFHPTIDQGNPTIEAVCSFIV